MKKLINKVLVCIGLATMLSVPSLTNAKGSTECLAKTIYFEARGLSIKSQQAVAHVVKNRVKSKKYPNSVCSVVHQAKQFSSHLNKGTSIKNKKAYNQALKISKEVLNGQSKDVTKGAIYFHNYSINPRWARNLRKTYSDGYHHFYKP